MLLADKFLCYYEIKANWSRIKVLAYISFKVLITSSLIFFYNDIELHNKKVLQAIHSWYLQHQ